MGSNRSSSVQKEEEEEQDEVGERRALRGKPLQESDLCAYCVPLWSMSS